MFDMVILHVTLHVKADRIEEFKALITPNAQGSVNEPGCERFDVFQKQDDPTQFLLIEVYHQASDIDFHKTTAHYAKFRDNVDELLVTPRVATRFSNVWPGEDGW